MVKRPSAAIRVGLWALPLYGALTAWATLDPQPNQVTDPDGGRASSARTITC